MSNASKSRTPPRIPGLIDSHCHLDYPPMSPDIEATLDRARAAGVERCVHIGCSPDSMARAVEIARAHEHVYASVGIHPHDARHLDATLLEQIETLARDPVVVAIGETGLDYHYDLSPRDDQLRGFGAQIDLARRLDKPLVLHIRDAHADAWAVLAEHPPRAQPGVVHCFTGTADEARRWLELGWNISFSGIATFKKAVELREAVTVVPSDRIMLETDSPYLAPEPLRGRKNEPANVAWTCVALAALRGETPAALAEASTRTTCALFKIPMPTGPTPTPS